MPEARSSRGLLAAALAAGGAYRFALFLAATPERRLYAPDSADYLVLAKNLAAGGPFSRDPRPPFRPEILRTPVYPSFLAGLDRLGLALPAAGVLAGVLLSCLAIVLVFAGAGKWGLSRRGSAAAAFFVALDLGAAAYANFLLSESLFVVLLLLAFGRLGRGVSDRPAGAVPAGLLLGLAILCRPIALGLPFALSLGRRLRFSAVLILSSGAVVVPWMIRNAATAGSFTVSWVASVNLYYHRAEKVLDAGRGREEEPPANPPGENDPAALSRMRREGLSVLRRHPATLVRLTLKAWARTFGPDERPLFLLLGGGSGPKPSGCLEGRRASRRMRRWPRTSSKGSFSFFSPPRSCGGSPRPAIRAFGRSSCRLSRSSRTSFSSRDPSTTADSSADRALSRARRRCRLRAAAAEPGRMRRAGSISVVVAVGGGLRPATGCADSFLAQLDPERGDELLLETGSASALVPQLWTRGIQRASGEIVALTIGSMVAEPGWADEVRAAMAGLRRGRRGDRAGRGPRRGRLGRTPVPLLRVPAPVPGRRGRGPPGRQRGLSDVGAGDVPRNLAGRILGDRGRSLYPPKRGTAPDDTAARGSPRFGRGVRRVLRQPVPARLAQRTAAGARARCRREVGARGGIAGRAVRAPSPDLPPGPGPGMRRRRREGRADPFRVPVRVGGRRGGRVSSCGVLRFRSSFR